MKKLVFGIIVIMMVAACTSNNKKNTSDSSDTKGFAPEKKAAITYTLNGLSYASADSMVHAFINYKGTYKAPTCFWFNKTDFQKMDSIIQNKDYDGLRVYFSRVGTDDYNKFALVIVATKDSGEISGAKGRHEHKDFFFTSNIAAGVKGELDTDGVKKGSALLYGGQSPCNPSNNCTSITNNDHYVPCGTARTMVQKMNGDEINASSEWFDKGIIHQLSAKINAGGGIRIYFVRHLKEAPGDNQKRHGFLFVLTEKDTNGNQTDDYKCFTLQPYTKYLKTRRSGTMAGDGGDGGGTDNGEECPNACEGVTWP